MDKSSGAVVAMHRGRKIVDTRHSIDRFYDKERFNLPWSEEDFSKKIVWVISNAIDKILDEYHDQASNPTTDSSYVIHSKSTGIGVVVVWRWEWDRYRTDDKNHAIIRTLLPVKQVHRVTHTGDILLIVEHQLRDWAIEQQRKNHILLENIFQEGAYSHSNDDTFVVHLWEGEYWDCNGTIILVP
jgi:hypothetical protein